MARPPEQVGVALVVADVLSRLGIEHMVCGSVASSLLGEPRSTHDVDFILDLSESHIAPLVSELEKDFFVDPHSLHWALESKASCNVLHRNSGMKVDLFVLRPRAYSREELKRRIGKLAAVDPDRYLNLATPEDMILTKLEWYRKGGEVSDRQWRDVLGLIKLQRQNLDRTYLDHWAGELEVADLLARAFAETR